MNTTRKGDLFEDKVYNIIVVGAGVSGLFFSSINTSPGPKLIINNTVRPGLKLIASGGGQGNITNIVKIKEFIDKYGDKYQLKFSTLRGVNRFSVEREYVSWLEESHKLEKVMIFNNEVYSYKYRGYYIDRKNVEPIYSKEKLPTSLKVHPNGIIDYTWDEPWNKSYN